MITTQWIDADQFSAEFEQLLTQNIAESHIDAKGADWCRRWFYHPLVFRMASHKDGHLINVQAFQVSPGDATMIWGILSVNDDDASGSRSWFREQEWHRTVVDLAKSAGFMRGGTKFRAGGPIDASYVQGCVTNPAFTMYANPLVDHSNSNISIVTYQLQ